MDLLSNCSLPPLHVPHNMSVNHNNVAPNTNYVILCATLQFPICTFLFAQSCLYTAATKVVVTAIPCMS